MCMRTIRLAAALLAMTSASTAMAANWRINSHANPIGGGAWIAGCEAYVGDVEDDFRLELDEDTLALRFLRGEDIYRPVLVLQSDASQGRSRPKQTESPAVNCAVYGTYLEILDDGEQFHYSPHWETLQCVEPNDEREFQFSYSLSGVQGTQRAWVFGDRNWVIDSEDNTLLVDSATTYWLDYPPAMFDTNASKSIRITMGGVRRESRAAENHWQHQRFSYSHGAEMMALMRSCIDAHIRRGHVDLPNGSESIQEIKRRRAEREFRARHSR